MLRTPPGQSGYLACREAAADPPTLVCIVGKTTLGSELRCLEDLRPLLTEDGDWMAFGTADEQKPAADGTVEAWPRSPENPVGGWYGVKKGPRGRFTNYVPRVMEYHARKPLHPRSPQSRKSLNPRPLHLRVHMQTRGHVHRRASPRFGEEHV